MPSQDGVDADRTNEPAAPGAIVPRRRHSDRRREILPQSSGLELHLADLSLVVGVEASSRED